MLGRGERSELPSEDNSLPAPPTDLSFHRNTLYGLPINPTKFQRTESLTLCVSHSFVATMCGIFAYASFLCERVSSLRHSFPRC